VSLEQRVWRDDPRFAAGPRHGRPVPPREYHDHRTCQVVILIAVVRVVSLVSRLDWLVVDPSRRRLPSAGRGAARPVMVIRAA
jgi:hypothetical protein